MNDIVDFAQTLTLQTSHPPCHCGQWYDLIGRVCDNKVCYKNSKSYELVNVHRDVRLFLDDIH